MSCRLCFNNSKYWAGNKTYSLAELSCWSSKLSLKDMSSRKINSELFFRVYQEEVQQKIDLIICFNFPFLDRVIQCLSSNSIQHWMLV